MHEKAIAPVPCATYRLQFRNDITFERAIDLIPHLRALGISHLYASPIFTAVSGSTHGYDVVDPNAIDPAIGGMEGFLRLSDELREAGLGLILDIVPNHLAASLENPFWRDILKWGRDSAYAGFFDTDWEQKVSLPVLGADLGQEMRAGEARLRWAEDLQELVFDYRGSAYPLHPATHPAAFRSGQGPEGLENEAIAARPGKTADLERRMAEFLSPVSGEDLLLADEAGILALLDRQPWKLMSWREAPNGLSYRRFFEITGLVGVRVEDPAVFDATHRLVLDLVDKGRVQGLRIDHIDGLADPASYLRRLRAAVGPDRYIVVEKILEGEEALPQDWPVAGTTGYEFIADLAGLFAAEAPELDLAWAHVAPNFGTPEAALAAAKRLMVEVNFAGEIKGLVRSAVALARISDRFDISERDLFDAIRSVVTAFHVYRTYGSRDGLSERDRSILEDLFVRLEEGGKGGSPALVFLSDVLLGSLEEGLRPAAGEFRTRLQHLTGPVLAKSIEDTFFYRYNRLIALNEVGGEAFGRAVGIAHFHERMLTRRQLQPGALTATSTHDTKRGEDARARLSAISEAPAAWVALTRRWRRMLGGHVRDLAGGPAPEPAVQWLLFQALAGALPMGFELSSPAARGRLLARFLPYVEKVLREAKLRSNWSDVDEAYEQAVKDYAAAMIEDGSFLRDFVRDIEPFVATGRITSLCQVLLKITVPGVPDIYQGAEWSDFSLVDPDNRMVPDFAARTLDREEPPFSDFDRTKAWLTATVLRFRQRHPDLFGAGDYLPLAVEGERSDNVVAFARHRGGEWAITVVPRLIHSAIAEDRWNSPDFWVGTSVVLPVTLDELSDVLDGQCLTGEAVSDHIPVERLFKTRPLAFLHARSR
jgi:(1->4)-alpha-D-glucan 1-alpha-D-glucosylmutase